MPFPVLSRFAFLSIHRAKQIVRLLLPALFVLLPAAPALADLMLHPTRVVLEKNQRAAQVELINNGTEEATYRISLVHRRMNEVGEFSSVESALPDEQFADHMLRFSPRQITLAPGQGQTVRIMLRKPAELTAGEYRSHLQFDRQPEVKGASSVESVAGQDGKEIGVNLTALIGASIPVIVRHGDTSASVSISDLSLRKLATDPAPLLSLQMQRSGNRSVYGDVLVSFISAGGAEHQVAKAGGVAVYTPNTIRHAKLTLQPPSGVALSRGTLRVTYRERPEAGGKLLAEASLILP